MALAVRDILNCKALSSAAVIAGRHGLSGRISSVTVGEVPDIGDWLSGDEIVLSTFFATISDREGRIDFVRRIIKGGASALIAKPGRYIQTIDPEIVVLADRQNFPVIQVPTSIRWTHIIQQITELILGEQTSLLKRSEEIHQTLLGLVLAGGDLAEVATASAALLRSPVAILDLFGHELAASSDWTGANDEVGYQPIVAGQDNLGSVAFVRLDPLQPLDVVALEHTATVAAVEIGRLKVRFETEMRLRGDLLDDMLESRLATAGALLERSASLGANLTGGALSLICATTLPQEDDRSREELFRICAQILGERHADSLIVSKRKRLVVFLPGPVELEAARITASRLGGAISRRFPDSTTRIGLGRYYPEPERIRMSYVEAETALQIGDVSGSAGETPGVSVIAFDDVGPYRLLFKLLQADPHEFDLFYDESVRPIVEYDDKHGTELMKTLDAYLSSNENIAAAGELLFSHRHTVRYRLGRITAITGLDVNSSAGREVLSLGLKAHKLKTAARPISILRRGKEE